MKNLIRTIVNTFYDNIIEEEVWDQDIIIFIANVIKVLKIFYLLRKDYLFYCFLNQFEVDSASKPSDIKFKSN